MSTHSQGHPPIPSEVPAEDVIAIVSVHDPQAANVNRDTPYRKTRLSNPTGGKGRRTNEGCHIFIHHIEGQPCYLFGRGGNKTSAVDEETLDVFLPGTKIGAKQFVLIPVWDSNVWRLQSRTETVATVNDVPIQAYTNRTKKKKDPLPHAIHLKSSTINHISIKGLGVEIWLLKSVREVYPTSVFNPEPLQYHLQDVARRPEHWARDRYVLSSEQVSTHSYRAVERFTSEVQTVKVFRDEQHGQRLRDEEFVKFGKEDVDASIVRYQQSVELDNVPAIITSTHDGFATYAALQTDIKKQHPGVRFSIAAKLLRRLFSALGFLNHHGIIHGQVTHESVLLRLTDYRPDAIILVDYSNSTTFPNGALSPLDAIRHDGRAAMTIIEDCCDIWQLRKAAKKDARSEEFMAKKTTTAQKEHQSVERVVADFERQGGSRTSDKGKKLRRLLELKNHSWHRCQDEQMYNATLREVGVCYKSNIDDMSQEWDESHPPHKIGEKHFMLLSLGHPWFDQLATQLHHDRWDTTPQEVCAKFKELAGTVEEPWQTFEVTKTIIFLQGPIGSFDEKCVMAWLAGCCEAFPEWHKALEMESERHLRPRDGTITRFDIRNLRDALPEHGRLPESFLRTFNLLCMPHGNKRSFQITETYHVSMHTPSRMFNLTQLQRLASADRFALCVHEGSIRCDNYVEVRGDPKLQGCYVPLSLLTAFALQLDLSVTRSRDQTPLFPTFDPSDFSQVQPGKIVLARTGLVAFATITRSGNQCVFHAPKSYKHFETSNTFLPTYFGDMKVLPRLPAGVREHVRPNHWSKFKTAEEIEAAGSGKRKILRAKGPLDKFTAAHRSTSRTASPVLPTVMEVDETALSRTLKQRQHIRSQARPPTKRNTDAQSSVPSTPSSKRSCPPTRGSTPPEPQKTSNVTMSFLDRATERMERMAAGLPTNASFSVPRIPPNSSFYQRNVNVNANLLSSPPLVPADRNDSFTIAAGSFNLDEDWKQTEEWLKGVRDDSDEEPQVQGIFGFNFHHSHLQDGSSTEEESTPGSKGKSKCSENGRSMKKVSERSPTTTNPAVVTTPKGKGKAQAQASEVATTTTPTRRARRSKATAPSSSPFPSFPHRPTLSHLPLRSHPPRRRRAALKNSQQQLRCWT
ncbi:hypothetical protein N0V83_007585 [Neocucurbitaria cava]|uniref:Protein kinase domain-containing protein n=1 Tax=Neocucurbitaria cava TaxID=798079 RepID=A0A9W9CJK4_9PLEO|nr:hypothetical protein N0V83_007585 [Neocucurbitaria cava]